MANSRDPLQAQQNQAEQEKKRKLDQAQYEDACRNAQAFTGKLKYWLSGTFKRNEKGLEVGTGETNLEKLRSGVYHAHPDNAKRWINLRYDENKREFSVDFNPQFPWHRLSDADVAQALLDMIRALKQQGVRSIVIDTQNMSYMTDKRLRIALAIAENEGMSASFGPHISNEWLPGHVNNKPYQESYRGKAIQTEQQRRMFDELTQYSKPSTWENLKKELEDNQLAGSTEDEKKAAVRKAIEANTSAEEKATDETAATVKAIDKDIKACSKRLTEVEKIIDKINNGDMNNPAIPENEREKGLQAALAGIDNYQQQSLGLESTHKEISGYLGSVYKHEDLTLKRLKEMQAMAHEGTPALYGLLAAAQQEKADLKIRLNTYKTDLEVHKQTLEQTKAGGRHEPAKAALLDEALAITQRQLTPPAAAADGAQQPSALDKQLAQVKQLGKKIDDTKLLHTDLKNRINQGIAHRKEPPTPTPAPGGPAPH